MLAWFAADYPVLLAAVRQAAQAGFDTHAWQLPLALENYFACRGHWHDWAAIQRIALAAARRLDDRAAEALACRSLGNASAQIGSYPAAHAYLQHALDLYLQLGDAVGQGQAHFGIAVSF